MLQLELSSIKMLADPEVKPSGPNSILIFPPNEEVER